MFKKIGILVLLLIAAATAFIATRSDDFHVQRSAVINAPPGVVFPMINDFHRWVEWSPYEKFDPKMKKSFEGPTSGSGASYAWSGNDQAGEGRTTIVESKPDELVAMKLEFTRPFAGMNQVHFNLAPAEGGTKVTWSMDGKKNFMAKAFTMFMDCDSMCGAQFEEGLANLNKLVQNKALTKN
jgi:hypothetical protein